MKEIDLNGITHIRPIREGTPEWYFGIDYTCGDLYEAQEIFETEHSYKGNRMYIVHFPDGEVFEPVVSREDLAIGEPVCHGGKISFVTLDLKSGIITIHRFSCNTHKVSTVTQIPLDSINDCYNLRLFEHPLCLTRQPNDGTLEFIWPERKVISISDHESFFYRDEDRLFFDLWHEDPDYRTETVIRSYKSGEITERLSGDIQIMPDGGIWHLKGS